MAVKRLARKARKARRTSKSKRVKKRVMRRPKRITKKMQTGTMRRVWFGKAVYTKGGLTKKDLCMNKRGRVVSKRRMLIGKKAYAQIKAWSTACELARKKLGLKGFFACKKGSEYYRVAKQFYKKLTNSRSCVS